MKLRGEESNIWKYFIFSLSQRRNYFPILSIFFLSLPNTFAQQIGIYTGIGYLASFLLEIPSGYFADNIGHKKTLILSKLLMVSSVILLINAHSFIHFVLYSILLSSAMAFESGTNRAFMHNTLIGINREKDYTKITSQISANVSILSALLIFILPFFSKISLVLPFKINLVFDIIGLGIALTFVSPKIEIEAKKEEPLPIFSQLKNLYGGGFYTTAIFLGIIGGFMIASSSYRDVYLTSIGFPVIIIGSVMALSRVFWFLFANISHKIEKCYSIKQILLFEVIIFPLVYLVLSFISNFYLSGLLFAIILGYYYGREQIMTHYFLNKFCPNKRYKATLLSIKTQVSAIIQVIFSVGLGLLMGISYKTGYLVSSILLFILLVITYLKVRGFPILKNIKNN